MPTVNLFRFLFSYPGKKYTVMVDSILHKWPHLRMEFECPDDVRRAYKERIRYYFKNARSRNSLNVPEINAMKRKIKRKSHEGDNESTPPYKRKYIWGCT